MAPKDDLIGWYPKKKPVKETKHYELKNIGLIKDKKGKGRNLF